MKAIVWTAYGSPDGLKLQDLPMPAVGEHDVLIRLQATTVITGDCEMRRLDLPRIFRLPIRIYNGYRAPKRIRLLGQEFAGTVEAVGTAVRDYLPGDRVFGATGFGQGTYAEYISLSLQNSDNVIARLPENLAFDLAAALPVGSLEALYFIRRANLKENDSILINGAGGSIGTIAVQLARNLGADVTAIDHSDKLDRLSRLGANTVIGYDRQDYTLTDQRYQAVFDLVGNHSLGQNLKLLKPYGRYLLANPTLGKLAAGPLLAAVRRKRLVTGVSSRTPADMDKIVEWFENGIIRPVIDRVYPLESMAEAHRYVDSGQKLGNVVIDIALDQTT